MQPATMQPEARAAISDSRNRSGEVEEVQRTPAFRCSLMIVRAASTCFALSILWKLRSFVKSYTTHAQRSRTGLQRVTRAGGEGRASASAKGGTYRDIFVVVFRLEEAGEVVHTHRMTHHCEHSTIQHTSTQLTRRTQSYGASATSQRANTNHQ